MTARRDPTAPLSLRWVVPLVLLIFVVASLVITPLVLIPLSQRHVVDRAVEAVYQRLTQLQGTIDTFLRVGNLEAVRRELTAIISDPAYRAAVFVDDNDRVLAATRFAWEGKPLTEVPLPVDHEVLARVRASRTTDIDPREDEDRIVGYVSINLGARPGEIRPGRRGGLILDYDLTPALDEVYADGMRQSIGVNAVFIVAAIVLGLMFHFALTRRVGRLGRAVRALEAGDLTARANIGGRDEIGALAEAFDHMAEALEDHVREVRESREQNERLLNSAAEGFVGVGRDGELTFINPAALRILGRDETEADALRGSQVHDLLHGDSDPGTCRLFKAMTHGERMHATDRFRHGSGGWVDVEFGNEPVRDADDRLLGAVVTFEDISERLTTERSLAAKTAELERSNAELQQFSYAISHDLQEPLRMVSGYVELLRRKYADQMGEEADEFIDFAVDGAKRMQGMISDLLDYSRVHSKGKAPSPVAAREALDEALANLQVAIEDAGAEIAVDETLPTVMADHGQLVRVFQNLIGNAVKYRAPDRPPEVTVTATVEGGTARFTVGDNGIGFESDQAERVFGVFQRLHRDDAYAGTGIGLALVKRIVERHGGAVTAEGEPDKGARFTFTLPVA